MELSTDTYVSVDGAGQMFQEKRSRWEERQRPGL